MPGFALALDYDRQVPSLQRLIKVSKRTQWDVDDIDWSRETSGGDYLRILDWHGATGSEYVRSLDKDKKEKLARQFVAFDFSQILHGEQGAMMLAGQLTNAVEDLDAKLFAAIQVKDEARHVEAVRSLIRRIGPIYPIGPVLEETLGALIACPLWPKQVLGLQLFLEARALLTFREHLLFVADPVFRDTIGNIERDEAQHVGFGIQHLKTGVAALTAQERDELIEYGCWLDRNIWLMTKKEEYRAVFEECDLDFDRHWATWKPASKLHPGISPQLQKTSDLMQRTFQRWFFTSLDRIGLAEVGIRSAEARNMRIDASLTTPVDAAMLEILPWARPLADTDGPAIEEPDPTSSS